MRFITLLLTWLLFSAAPLQAQMFMGVASTINTLSVSLDGIRLGMTQDAFMLIRPQCSDIWYQNEQRTVTVDSITFDGITAITFYFAREGQRPLYEFVVEFDDQAMREDAAFDMLGPANFPGQANQWVINHQDSLITLAWAYDNMLVVAANLPDTEWQESDFFQIPSGFSAAGHLPQPTNWPLDEKQRFQNSLRKQINARENGFEAIRGKPLETNPAYMRCLQPVSIAQSASVFRGDNGKWWLSNNLIEGLGQDEATTWTTEMKNMISTTKGEMYVFVPAAARKVIGLQTSVWDIVDLQGNKTGFQLGLTTYEWGDEGLWNIDLMIVEP
jgi:hypothetical protein